MGDGTDSLLVSLGGGRRKEGHHARQIGQEHPSRLDPFHEEGAAEAAHGEGALRTGEVLGSSATRGAGPGLDGVVDKVAGDSHCASRRQLVWRQRQQSELEVSYLEHQCR